MGKLLDRVLGISVFLFIIFCLLSKPVQSRVLKGLEVIFDMNSGDLENNLLPKEDTSQTTKYINSKVYSKETISYFNKIVLNDEYGKSYEEPFKRTEDVKIYVQGDKRDYLMDELDRIVSELNDIIQTIEIEVVDNKSDANTFIFFGDYNKFDKLYPQINEKNLVHNWGYFEIYKNYSLIYVDIFRANKIDAQKQLLREELTQSLGLINDSYTYPESIFYQGWTTTTEYAPIDREVIDMLYNN